MEKLGIGWLKETQFANRYPACNQKFVIGFPSTTWGTCESSQLVKNISKKGQDRSEMNNRPQVVQLWNNWACLLPLNKSQTQNEMQEKDQEMLEFSKFQNWRLHILILHKLNREYHPLPGLLVSTGSLSLLRDVCAQHPGVTSDLMTSWTRAWCTHFAQLGEGVLHIRLEPEQISHLFSLYCLYVLSSSGMRLRSCVRFVPLQQPPARETVNSFRQARPRYMFMPFRLLAPMGSPFFFIRARSSGDNWMNVRRKNFWKLRLGSPDPGGLLGPPVFVSFLFTQHATGKKGARGYTAAHRNNCIEANKLFYTTVWFGIWHLFWAAFFLSLDYYTLRRSRWDTESTEKAISEKLGLAIDNPVRTGIVKRSTELVVQNICMKFFFSPVTGTNSSRGGITGEKNKTSFGRGVHQPRIRNPTQPQGMLWACNVQVRGPRERRARGWFTLPVDDF